MEETNVISPNSSTSEGTFSTPSSTPPEEQEGEALFLENVSLKKENERLADLVRILQETVDQQREVIQQSEMTIGRLSDDMAALSRTSKGSGCNGSSKAKLYGSRNSSVDRLFDPHLTTEVEVRNRFTPLFRLDCCEETESNTNSLRLTQKQSKNKEKRKKKKKLIVIGDSQCRGLSFHLNQRMKDTHEICTFAKPGARFSEVAAQLEEVVERNQLSDEDHVVIIAGSNDIRSKTDVARSFNINNIRKVCKRTNVIVSEVPIRHDLPGKFKEVVESANKVLRNSLKSTSSQIINLSKFYRNCFDRNGLHYSNLGKSVLASEIAKLASSFSVLVKAL